MSKREFRNGSCTFTVANFPSGKKPTVVTRFLLGHLDGFTNSIGLFGKLLCDDNDFAELGPWLRARDEMGKTPWKLMSAVFSRFLDHEIVAVKDRERSAIRSRFPEHDENLGEIDCQDAQDRELIGLTDGNDVRGTVASDVLANLIVDAFYTHDDPAVKAWSLRDDAKPEALRELFIRALNDLDGYVIAK